MILRGVVLAIAAAVVLGALVALPWAGPAALPPLFWGAVVLAGVLFERVRYKRLRDAAPGPGFRPTPERFVDPATGERVRVWSDPASGARSYVRE